MSGNSRAYPPRPLVGIGIVVLRPAGKDFATLLIRRSRPPAQGAWSLPGGAQRLGETAEAAARRELLEETGCATGPLSLVSYIDSIHRDEAGAIEYHYTILDFAGLWMSGEGSAGGDAAALCWAMEADFPRLNLWDEAIRMITMAKALIARPATEFAPPPKLDRSAP
ncbi:MAG TPA: NUDIX hydrolase [Acetobacteraceae bacterium]|nr:NUDIX hydrolase [Acetobacteraceae bacterium]